MPALADIRQSPGHNLVETARRLSPIQALSSLRASVMAVETSLLRNWNRLDIPMIQVMSLQYQKEVASQLLAEKRFLELEDDVIPSFSRDIRVSLEVLSKTTNGILGKQRSGSPPMGTNFSSICFQRVSKSVLLVNNAASVSFRRFWCSTERYAIVIFLVWELMIFDLITWGRLHSKLMMRSYREGNFRRAWFSL